MNHEATTDPPSALLGGAPSLLQELKRATHDEHVAVEGLVHVMDPSLTLPGYRAYLARMHGYFAPVEQALARVPELDRVVPELDRRLRKGEWLAADLQVFGGGAEHALARHEELPALASTAAGLGCLYVLEGSTLGGQVIARHVEATLGTAPGRGGTFARSYGAEVGRMWREFGAAVEAWAAHHRDERGLVIATARATFATLGRWLSREARP